MTTKDMVSLFKRFIIIFLLCSPIIIVLTLTTKIPSGWVIVISVVIIGLIFLLEEYIRFKRLKKKQERREKLKGNK